MAIYLRCPVDFEERQLRFSPRLTGDNLQKNECLPCGCHFKQRNLGRGFEPDSIEMLLSWSKERHMSLAECAQSSDLALSGLVKSRHLAIGPLCRESMQPVPGALQSSGRPRAGFGRP
jgi:hypothetical protein